MVFESGLVVSASGVCCSFGGEKCLEISMFIL